MQKLILMVTFHRPCQYTSVKMLRLATESSTEKQMKEPKARAAEMSSQRKIIMEVGLTM